MRKFPLIKILVALSALIGLSLVSALAQAGEVVLYAKEANVKAGRWAVTSDSKAAGGARLRNANRGAQKLKKPLSDPDDYFEMSFYAEAGKPYRLWLRGVAEDDYQKNDSVFVQFSDSVDKSGNPVYLIGTRSGTHIILQECLACTLSGWGWQDNGWGVGELGPEISTLR